ncbi:uncharacterized protein LOC117902630 [Drosophila subobscura]|uniref:uncharacterized protein LOC117902630 n=1 Tax=Drosophila subobscura TaxID=7241 RepID=UPI00155B2AC6|nr:uncharacterized protein LOC117902630 [Drosophila subobscura]
MYQTCAVFQTLLLALCLAFSLKTGQCLKQKYFVKSSVCEIPYINPFAADTMKDFQKRTYRECHNDSDLVTSEFDFKLNQYRLHLHENLARRMLNGSTGNATLECKYQKISRDRIDEKPDNSYSEFKSRPLPDNLLVPKHTDFMITKCYVKDQKKQLKLLQTDGLTFIEEHLQHEDQKRDYAQQQQQKPTPSVLMLGLDSTSRMNLRRAMPQVYKYVSQPGWFELQGYNKVGDNTFPNLLAVLAGHSPNTLSKKCNVSKIGCLDRVPFIWKRFKRSNYTTAFAEDCKGINTFNYLLPGFQVQPVDYYLRPFLVAIESKFPVTKNFGFPFCVGRRLSFDYVWDFGRQFAERFVKNRNIFGFLWSNSFTHDYYTATTALEQLFLKHLHSFEATGLFERSIVILMSDHGHRYNTLRQAASGYYEERLPMMFIYVPPWFRQQYPHLVDNLRKNRNRLSSSYDLHMTLQHLLQLESTSLADFAMKHRSVACPSCQSLLFELPFNRSCQQAGIDEKWCCCHATKTLKKNGFVRTLALAVVRRMNDHLVMRNFSHICHNFTLTHVHKIVRRLEQPADDNSLEEDETVYILQFWTFPNQPRFESTVRWNHRKHKLHMDVEDLSRLSSYNEDSNCINDKIAKKYCICKDSIRTIIRTLKGTTKPTTPRKIVNKDMDIFLG